MTPQFSDVICIFFFFFLRKHVIFYRIKELKTQQEQQSLSLVEHTPSKLIDEKKKGEKKKPNLYIITSFSLLCVERQVLMRAFVS